MTRYIETLSQLTTKLFLTSKGHEQLSLAQIIALNGSAFWTVPDDIKPYVFTEQPVSIAVLSEVNSLSIMDDIVTLLLNGKTGYYSIDSDGALYLVRSTMHNQAIKYSVVGDLYSTESANM